MSTFGDELRNLIAKKAEQLDVAEFYRRRQAAEKERKENELDAAAAGLCRDVFGPLVEELYQALAAAGVFKSGKHSGAGRHVNGAHMYTLSTHSATGIGMYRVRVYAAATAEGRIVLAAECQQRLPRSAKPIEAVEAVKAVEKPLPPPTWQQFFDTPDTPKYVDFPEETIRRAFEGRNMRSLVKIAGKSISCETAKMQNPSVEQWARAALKKIAEACVEAERGKA